MFDADVMDIDGGVRRKFEQVSLQDRVSAQLRELYPPGIFKGEVVITKVKNTSNIKCRKCGSDNIYVISKQLRASDEATTLIYECLNCGMTWKVN